MTAVSGNPDMELLWKEEEVRFRVCLVQQTAVMKTVITATWELDEARRSTMIKLRKKIILAGTETKPGATSITELK